MQKKRKIQEEISTETTIKKEDKQINQPIEGEDQIERGIKCEEVS